MMTDISTIIDEEIRPFLNHHHGDLELVSSQAGKIKLRVTGACSACPGLQNTLQEKIIGKLKEKCPQVQEVVLVQGVSEELIEQALQILRKAK